MKPIGLNYSIIIIGQIQQLNGGSNPPPSTPYTNSGTFINTNSPISAQSNANAITSWHYCYYPSAAADSQLTYTATVGVWRLNTATNQYELLPGSDFTLSEQPKSTLAVIVCRTENLQAQDYVSVQMGDVVGVSLPEQNPLPMVATDTTGFGLQVVNVPINAPAALQAAALNNAPDMALHLFPTVGMCNIELKSSQWLDIILSVILKHLFEPFHQISCSPNTIIMLISLQSLFQGLLIPSNLLLHQMLLIS